MEEQEDYSPVSRLIIGYLTGELSEVQQQSLADWANASEDHRRMMEEFKSVCWHAREARRFEEADKLASWARIQQQVAQLPGAPPLPDLRERQWIRKEAGSESGPTYKKAADPEGRKKVRGRKKSS